MIRYSIDIIIKLISFFLINIKEINIMSTDAKKRLIDMISTTLSESECNLFITIIKNKQHLGLLELEADWISRHDCAGFPINDCECSNKLNCSCYNGDYIFERRCDQEDLILSIFSKKRYDTKN